MPRRHSDNSRGGAVRAVVLWGGLLLVLAIVNTMIAGKERTLANGYRMLLELAPRDPRSLLQGDYMTLRYAMSAEVSRSLAKGSTSGRLLVHVDAGGVAHFVRVYEDGEALAANERLLFFRKRGNAVRVAGDAFFFQEGHGRHYAKARFGELRVDSDGHAILVGLSDRERKPLSAPIPPGGDG